MTAAADEVDMGLRVRIEAFHTVYGADADDQSLFLKQSQVPVDRAQGDVRILGFQLGNVVD